MHMAEIGRRGGRSSANRRKLAAEASGAAAIDASQKSARPEDVELERTVNEADLARANEGTAAQPTGLSIPADETSGNRGIAGA